MNEDKKMMMDPSFAKAAEGKSILYRVAAVFFAILCLFYIAKTVSEFKNGSLIGTNTTPSTVITVNGTGDVVAIPDIATFDFTVNETAKLVSDAQTAATTKSNKVLSYLKANGIADKDVQTTDYSISPKYEYSQTICPVGNYCPQKQTLVGYEVTQTVEVKVRDTSKAGSILSEIGQYQVSNVSGLAFDVDNKTDLIKQARAKAIADAQSDAQALAQSLGVKLVRVVNYSDQQAPQPYYGKVAMMSAGVSADAAVPAPQIPVGENKYTSNVSVTYEIR